MSYRGSDESDSENSVTSCCSENNIQVPNSVNFSGFRAPRLLLQNTKMENQTANSNTAFSQNFSIAELKEYLEIVPVFKGEPELVTYFIQEAEKVINHFYDIQNVANPRNDYITSRIRSKIQGNAALYLANKDIRSWSDIRNAIKTAYQDKRDDATLAIEISKLEQGNESPFDFYKNIQRLLHAQIAYANLEYGLNDGLNNHFRRVALKTLLNGLKDPLGSLMRTKDPADMETALNLLSNTYQKEIHSQKIQKNQNSNVQKPKSFFKQQSFFPNSNNQVPNYNPGFTANPQHFNNNFNAQNFKGTQNNMQSPKQNYSSFNRLHTPSASNYQPTPMSISTNNTYRSPFKQQHQQSQRTQHNYNSEKFYNINDEPNENSNGIINDHNNDSDVQEEISVDEDNYSPYNDFLGVSASETDHSK